MNGGPPLGSSGIEVLAVNLPRRVPRPLTRPAHCVTVNSSLLVLRSRHAPFGLSMGNLGARHFRMNSIHFRTSSRPLHFKAAFAGSCSGRVEQLYIARLAAPTPLYGATILIVALQSHETHDPLQPSGAPPDDEPIGDEMFRDSARQDSDGRKPSQQGSPLLGAIR